MQKFYPAIITVLLASYSFAALPNSVSAQSCTCAGVVSGITADEAPPPLPEYTQPPIPAPGYMWTPGYWSWNNADYYWVPGTWVEPPRPGVLWTPGYWGYSNGAYVFNRGYWGPHVGFYGGVSYGFGYGGSGYQGGRWDNGAFFYNRSVNNVGNTRITNVYNETVVNNVANNRSSFHGGPGGIAVKPTPEEEAAAKEQHEKPTSAQLQHTRAASMNAGSFASTNNGKPAVAATVKPGALTGPGVVKASAAGPTTPAPASGASTPGEEKGPKGTTAPGAEPQKTPERPELRTEPKAEPKPAAEPAPAEKGSTVKEPVHPHEPMHPAVEPAHPAAEPVHPHEPSHPAAEPVHPAAEPVHPHEPPHPAAEPVHPAAEPPHAHEPAHPAAKPEPHVEHPAPEKPRPEPSAAKPQAPPPQHPEHERPKCGQPGEPACH
jgi:WXXGXW repeat (2 copies)